MTPDLRHTTDDVRKDARSERHARQLRRLEVLMDVVFGLVLWRLFIVIPRPNGGDWE